MFAAQARSASHEGRRQGHRLSQQGPAQRTDRDQPILAALPAARQLGLQRPRQEVAQGIDRGDGSRRQVRRPHHLPRRLSQHAGARSAAHRAEREGNPRLRSPGRDRRARALSGSRDPLPGREGLRLARPVRGTDEGRGRPHRLPRDRSSTSSRSSACSSTRSTTSASWTATAITSQKPPRRKRRRDTSASRHGDCEPRFGRALGYSRRGTGCCSCGGINVLCGHAFAVAHSHGRRARPSPHGMRRQQHPDLRGAGEGEVGRRQQPVSAARRSHSESGRDGDAAMPGRNAKRWKRW